MLKELNQVMDYIEDHLTGDISLEMIADYAGVSDYHFRKIFFYLSGLTLSEYIKNRKLSEANKDLLQGEKVTDVAFKYGYESVDGFYPGIQEMERVFALRGDEKGHQQILSQTIIRNNR